jgi:predicted dehydrogenase
MKAMIDGGELGQLYYYDSTRINLGLFQPDVDVVWDLAPHDLSILDFLLEGQLPEAVSCSGATRFGKMADQAYLALTYADNFTAHVHVNWLAPVKTRQVLLCAERRMLVYDEITVGEKLRVYDRGIRAPQPNDPYQHMISYRDGDMWAPKLENREALAIEVKNVIDTLLGLDEPLVDGRRGYRVVRLLEILSESLREGGHPVAVRPADFALEPIIA